MHLFINYVETSPITMPSRQTRHFYVHATFIWYVQPERNSSVFILTGVGAGLNANLKDPLQKQNSNTVECDNNVMEVAMKEKMGEQT